MYINKLLNILEIVFIHLNRGNSKQQFFCWYNDIYDIRYDKYHVIITYLIHYLTSKISTFTSGSEREEFSFESGWG